MSNTVWYMIQNNLWVIRDNEFNAYDTNLETTLLEKYKYLVWNCLAGKKPPVESIEFVIVIMQIVLFSWKLIVPVGLY